MTGFRAGPDSRTVFLTVEEHGRDKVFSLTLPDGAPRPLSPGGAGVYSGIDVGDAAAAPVVAANWMAMPSPPEVVRTGPQSGGHAVLTGFTKADAADLDWQPPREFWFTARNGRRIHSCVVLPPAFDANKKYRLPVFMHGGPHQAWKDQWFTRWNYHLPASPGYVVLMTNSPRASPSISLRDREVSSQEREDRITVA